MCIYCGHESSYGLSSHEGGPSDPYPCAGCGVMLRGPNLHTCPELEALQKQRTEKCGRGHPCISCQEYLADHPDLELIGRHLMQEKN
jgi:hypothetical protein